MSATSVITDWYVVGVESEFTSTPFQLQFISLRIDRYIRQPPLSHAIARPVVSEPD